MKRTLVLLCAVWSLLGAAFAEGPSADTLPVGVKTALEIERQSALLEELQSQLHQLEASLAGPPAGMDAASVPKWVATDALLDLPAKIVTNILNVERRLSPRGLLYNVRASNVPVLEIFEAVSRTSGARLEIHPDLNRTQVWGRLTLDMKDVDIASLLDVLAGTQALGVRLDKEGILVAPWSALTTRPVDERLAELAVESYQRALVQYPTSPEAPAAYLGIARYYAERNLDAAAIDTAERLIERYPKSPACGEAYALVAECHERMGRLEDARKTCQRYLDRYPVAEGVAAMKLKLAETWIHGQAWDRAVPILDDILHQWEQSAEAPLARMRLAECLAAQKRYEAAVEQLRIVESAPPGAVKADELALLIADCLVKLKRHGPARVRLMRVIRESSSPLLAERAYYAMGDTFLAEGRAVEALESFKGAAAAFPEGVLIVRAPLSIARAYMAMGLYSKVAATLASAPDRSWSLAEARPIILALARHYIEQTDARRVLALLEDTRWPHDTASEPELLVIQAQAHLLNKSPRLALQNATVAARATSNEQVRAEALRTAGACYQLLGQTAAAALAYGGKLP